MKVAGIVRKLLHAIHGMLSTGTPFDGTRFYALRPTNLHLRQAAISW